MNVVNQRWQYNEEVFIKDDEMVIGLTGVKFMQLISKLDQCEVWGLWHLHVTILLRWFPHNIRAIMAKIKLPEKPRGMLLFWIQLIWTYRDLSSQADPARENWTWSCP